MFAPKTKKTTIRREAKDVYGANEPRKGLHTPQYQSKSPIDILFAEIEEKLRGSVEDITIDILYERIIGDEITESGNKEFFKKIQGYREDAQLFDSDTRIVRSE